ncbi:hypothetical protein C8R47DRAFT_1070539 [Mycena vitilis]|nr:hypothetical protein C8R47DRAFT_1070539 [Mycena vitilis]
MYVPINPDTMNFHPAKIENKGSSYIDLVDFPERSETHGSLVPKSLGPMGHLLGFNKVTAHVLIQPWINSHTDKFNQGLNQPKMAHKPELPMTHAESNLNGLSTSTFL